MSLRKPGMSLDLVTEGAIRSPYSIFREFPLGKSTAEQCSIVTYVRLEAGDPAPRHAHAGWTINIVVEGSCRLEDFPDVVLGPGHILTCEPNLQYGPVIPGPQGVTLFEIFDRPETRPPIWSDPDDPVCVAYEEWLNTHTHIKKD